ncbi:helix-turn-helix domain-containing protein [Microbacterium sp. NPDC076911]|uniref:helix-turn-helix domain-containing protein n=1 Tax=Microbacterium sp. NPDC076911 TaxID=3154958 RepID=UPI0034181C91
MNPRQRDIDDRDRSGVLTPSNLKRFNAEWIRPSADVQSVVDTYWAVQWRLPPDEAVAQRIVDFPAVTLSIEAGAVPARFVISTVRPGAWSRVISGAGSVFAIRLRPAGLAVVSDFDVLSVEHQQPVTLQNGARAHAMMEAVSDEESTLERAARSDAIIREMLQERPLNGAQRTANAAIDAIASSPHVRAGKEIAAELGVGERTLQRVLRSSVGLGPNEVARRVRLQEVVRQLSLPDADSAATAAVLGYVDQAHLINEFRKVAGTTPGRYIRDLRHAMGELHGTLAN